MLWEDAKGARRICFRILFCNAVMLMPSVMICFCSGFPGIQNPCLLSSFLLPAFLLMMIWYHRQMKHLPAALKKIVPRLEGSHPGIFREDLMRISDETFAKEKSETLDAVPEEKINDQLRDAVIDWYLVYVSAAVVLEGVFAVVCILAALNWQD